MNAEYYIKPKHTQYIRLIGHLIGFSSLYSVLVRVQEMQEICSLESRRENLRTKFGAEKLTQ